MRDDPFLEEVAQVLHTQHEHGAARVAALERALDEDRAPALVARELLAYATYIRDHIRWENEMIFEVVERVLDERVAAELLAEFRAIEAETLGPQGGNAFAGLRMSANPGRLQVF